jgi:Leucine-rich repeat (LRR) protein
LDAIYQIDLSDNDIVDVSGLAELITLESLDLHDNRLEDITPLANLTGLFTIILRNNAVADVTILGGLQNLSEIDIAQNEVSDISALGQLENLYALFISDNHITDLSPLSDILSLSWMFLVSEQRVEIHASGTQATVPIPADRGPRELDLTIVDDGGIEPALDGDTLTVSGPGTVVLSWEGDYFYGFITVVFE